MANIKEIDETRFGIDEGKHALNQVGSSITNAFEWKITRNISWNSRLFLFSNYHKSQGDFENVFNFSINRFFSTRISLHLRYDDDTKEEQGNPLMLGLKRGEIYKTHNIVPALFY